MRYAPPKNSLWGHSLRGMEPSAQRQRVEQFLDRAAADHVLSSGSLLLTPDPGGLSEYSDFETRFLEPVGCVDRRQLVPHLTVQQFEVCFTQLLEPPRPFMPGKHGVTVAACYNIRAWRVGDRREPTNSVLISHFGANAVLSTVFTFSDMAVFEYLKKTLDDVGLCQLNPKHVKAR